MPPSAGLAVLIFVPAPTHSNEIVVAICKLNLEKYTVEPSGISLFSLVVNTILEVPFSGNDALSRL